MENKGFNTTLVAIVAIVAVVGMVVMMTNTNRAVVSDSTVDGEQLSNIAGKGIDSDGRKVQAQHRTTSNAGKDGSGGSNPCNDNPLSSECQAYKVCQKHPDSVPCRANPYQPREPEKHCDEKCAAKCNNKPRCLRSCGC